jgi:hypothetical protein
MTSAKTEGLPGMRVLKARALVERMGHMVKNFFARGIWIFAAEGFLKRGETMEDQGFN